MELTTQVMEAISAGQAEALELLRTIATIPAPSGQEQARIVFCHDWLLQKGAKDLRIDAAGNLLYFVGDAENGPIRVVMAHGDTVFPDRELTFTQQGGKLYCPGVGDNSASVAALLIVAKYIAEQQLKPQNGSVLLAVNTGEEGLGNLRGCRRILEDYGDRITEVIAVDGNNCTVYDSAIGSKRYRVRVRTQGGHSYANFGRPNAIRILAGLIGRLYAVELPQDGIVTYNVGTIQGGTSVNTIAQEAEMLYEIRSDNRRSMAAVEGYFLSLLDELRQNGTDVSCELLGDRPCAGTVSEDAQNALRTRAADAVARWFGEKASFAPGSTDCNIPLSLGVPSVCVACYRGHGAHTREEYVEQNSLLPGYHLAFVLILQYL